jgi:hypothetical protein
MTSLRAKVLIGIALVAFLAGVGGAIIRGYWGVSQDCYGWVDSHGYQLVRNDWWAKNRGCVARTPAGDEVYHSEELGSKAIGWAWQFALFAVGTLPAATIVTVSVFRSRRRAPGANP